MFQYMKQINEKLAIQLDNAAKGCSPIKQLSINQQFDISEAYEIQRLSINKRIDRNESLTGYKLGFTSKAKMEQMGLSDVIWGRLTDSMAIPNGGLLHFNKFIHPRVEPEIAFKVSKTIDDIINLENAAEYIAAIAPAIEVIDSRYENFKFSLEDVIADNCSSSGYILGEWLASTTPINHVEISLLINGQLVQKGNTSAILGNPIASLVELSKMAKKYGFQIKPGHIVLAGAATPAEYISMGDRVVAEFQGLKDVTLSAT